jgi:hypothetical protein
MVQEFEGISLDATWQLPAMQFLNDLAYMKLKLEWDEQQLNKSRRRS